MRGQVGKIEAPHSNFRRERVLSSLPTVSCIPSWFYTLAYCIMFFVFFLRERLLKEPLEGATKQQKELQQTKTMLKNPLSPSVVGSGLPVSGFTLQRAAADASSHQSLASALDVPCTPQIAVFVPKATRHSRGSRLARSLVASSLLRRKVKRRVYSRAGAGSKRSAFLFVRFSGIEEPSFQGVQKGSVKKMHAHKTP